MTKILHIRSAVQSKVPQPDDLEYGELAVNYHSGSPALYIKTNDGNVVKMAPGAVQSGPTPPPSGNSVGDIFFDTSLNSLVYWDGSQWVPVGNEAIEVEDLADVTLTNLQDTQVLAYDAATGEWVNVDVASLAVDVDLDYTPDPAKGTVTNTAGDNADIPLVENTTGGNAGLMSADDKVKLDTVTLDANGDVTNVKVDLDYTAAADKGTVVNSAGDDAVIPFATSAEAGLFQEAPTPDAGSVQYAREVDDQGAASWAPVEIPPGTLIDDGTGLPATPEDGQLWFNTNDGRLYVYFEDAGGTSQWVDASPESAVPELEWDNILNKPDNLGLWERTGTTLSPVTAGDDISVGAGTFSGNTTIGGTPASPNITLSSDGSSYFKGKIDADKRIGVFLNTPPSTPNENAIVVSDGVNSKVIIKANGDGVFGPGTGSFSVNQDGCYFEGSTGTLIVTKDSGAAAGVDSAVWRSGQFGLGETITLNANGDAFFGGTIYSRNAASQSVHFTNNTAGLKLWASSAGSGQVGAEVTCNGSQAIHAIRFSRAGSTAGSIQIPTSGNIVYATSSDYRLKEDVRPIADSIAQLKALKPCNFLWKDSDLRQDGFLAHEVQEVIPSAATGTKDEVDENGAIMPQGIDPGKLVPMLTDALQKAFTRIEALEAEVQSLKGA